MSKSLNERIIEIELRKSGKYYAEDGLLHCLRCNAELQRRVINSKGISHLIDVPCRCPEIKKQQAIEAVRRGCFISPILSTYRYGSFKNKGNKPNPYLEKFIRKFLKIKKNGTSLYIYSSSSQTRVFNLARIANGLIDRGYKVKYLTTSLFISVWRTLNADYTELMAKLTSFEAIAFADFDLSDMDENELKLLYTVMNILISNGVTLLISAGKSIDDIQLETRYGQKIKELIKRKCMIIPVLDDIKDTEPKQVAKDVLWLFDDEAVNGEEEG